MAQDLKTDKRTEEELMSLEQPAANIPVERAQDEEPGRGRSERGEGEGDSACRKYGWKECTGWLRMPISQF